MPTSEERPVIQITIIDCEPGRQKEAVSVMAERARFMSAQPGAIAIRLYRSIDGKRIVNHIEWQSRTLLEAAHHAPEFRKEWQHFDNVTLDIDPHLYELALNAK